MEMTPAGSEPPQIIPAPPVLLRAESAPKKSGIWLHPISGALILFFDNLFFGAELVTLETALPVACFLAFTLTAAGVFLVQKKMSHDRFGAAAIKALFGGIVAGIPFSVAGTVVGTLVLILSGMSALSRKKDEKIITSDRS